MNARKAAYLALLYSSQKNIDETLAKWAAKENPEKKDLALAREIASGTIRRFLTLEALAKKLPIRSFSRLKKPERALLYMALYQFHFMDRIPVHAIVNETVKIAKKSFGVKKASFFNAVLRKVEEISLKKPRTINEWSSYYSYPEFFIRKLIRQYKKEKAEEILQVMNGPPKVMVRKRNSSEMILVKDPAKPAKSKDVYIQNRTPVDLIHFLAKYSPKKPKNILDLCAAPGGKLLLAHELYPTAKLTAVDASQRRMERFEENLQKYRIKAEVLRARAETWISKKKFDLIILDVPCSNSGALHKRPEARWRLEEENVDELLQLQKEILANALHVLSEKGVIWYLTCSILKEENQDVVQSLKKPFRTSKEKLILPDSKGADGGFGALIKTFAK